MKATMKETIEEAAENYANYNEQINKAVQEAVKFGAKWQQEQDKNKYSEEEVLDILYQWSMYKIDIELERLADELPNILPYNEWFEQFKKK
jgi:hypothetical protein